MKNIKLFMFLFLNMLTSITAMKVHNIDVDNISEKDFYTNPFARMVLAKLNMAKNNPIFKCPIKTCNNDSHTSQQNLLYHLKTAHNYFYTFRKLKKNSFIFTCPDNECSERFHSIDNLIEHLSDNQDFFNQFKKNSFICSYPNCNERFLSQQKLSKHLDKAHDFYKTSFTFGTSKNK